MRTPVSTPSHEPNQYAELAASLNALLEGERDFIANCANAAALVFHALDGLNWAGFYFAHGEELVLGPFQGKIACTRIAFGKGVCGTAAQTRTAQVVPDVHAFPGHIACDAVSNSEIVLPIVSGDRLIGVLDLDSPRLSRFSDADRQGLEAFVETLVNRTDF
jgi:GAF domain-containing protein